MIEIARVYLNHGFSVIPLEPHDKAPYAQLLPRGDDGRATWRPYQTRQATEEELAHWFGNGANANIGIVTGAISGIVVQDIDEPAGFAETHIRGGYPETPVSETGNGIHVFYQHPGYQVTNFVRRLPGMDLRGDGGYIVAPPSVHPNGHQYQWQTDLSVPVAPAPTWLETAWTPEPEIVTEAEPRPIQSNNYGEAALTKELDRLCHARVGTRNNTLVTAAFRMGQLVVEGRLDEEDTRLSLKLVGIQIGLTEKEVIATVNSGVNAGKRNARR